MARSAWGRGDVMRISININKLSYKDAHDLLHRYEDFLRYFKGNDNIVKYGQISQGGGTMLPPGVQGIKEDIIAIYEEVADKLRARTAWLRETGAMGVDAER